MEYDQSEKVRQVCTECIGLNKMTLLKIIDRCSDIQPVVRRAAFKRIASKVKLSVLKPDQINKLLERGLHDPCETVREVISQLISAWMSHAKPINPEEDHGTIVDFIHILDPIDLEFRSAQKALDSILSRWTDPTGLLKSCVEMPMFLNPDNQLPCPFDLNDMNAKNYSYLSTIAYVWFNIYDHLRKKDELDSEFLPALPDYVQLIKTLAKTLSVEVDFEHMEEDAIVDQTIQDDSVKFTLRYLLSGLEFFEVCDPHSRKLVTELPYEIIQLLTLENFDAIAPYIFHAAKLICKSEAGETETKLVKSWIEALRENAESQSASETAEPESTAEDDQEKLAEINEIKMKISNLDDELSELISKQEFMQAEIVKQKKQEFETLLGTFHYILTNFNKII